MKLLLLHLRQSDTVYGGFYTIPKPTLQVLSPIKLLMSTYRDTFYLKRVGPTEYLGVRQYLILKLTKL